MNDISMTLKSTLLKVMSFGFSYIVRNTTTKYLLGDATGKIRQFSAYNA